MAIDAPLKRASAVGVARPWARSQWQDATMSVGWRASVANNYGGLSFAALPSGRHPVTAAAGGDGLAVGVADPETLVVAALSGYTVGAQARQLSAAGRDDRPSVSAS